MENTGLLICLLAALMYTCVAQPDYCPSSHSDGSLSFSTELATLATECYGRSSHLLCCVNGFTSMRWFKKKSLEEDDKWEPFWDYSSRVYFSERNQTVKFDRLIGGDEGYYMCVASKAGSPNLNLTIWLKLLDCQQSTEPAKILLPETAHEVVKAQLGEKNKSVSCVGFCGFKENRPNCQTVVWRRLSPPKKLINETISEQEPYGRPREDYIQGNGMSLDLVFPKVRKEDFGDYECIVFSELGSATANITFMKEVVEPTSEAGLIVGWVVGVLFLVVGLGVLLYTQKDRIRLIRLQRFTDRQVMPEKTQDALIVGESKQPVMDFARAIQEQLPQYSFVISDEVAANLSTIAGLEELANGSVSVVVLLTGALVRVPHYRYFINTLVNPDLPSHHATIFVVLERTWEEEWRQYMSGEDVIPEDKAVIGGLLTAVAVSKTIHATPSPSPWPWRRICNNPIPLEDQATPTPSPPFLRALQLRMGAPLEREQEQEEEEENMLENHA